MRKYNFLLEFSKINPKNINYNDIDSNNNTSNNPNYQQVHINKMSDGTPYKENLFVSDALLENFALMVTCCKYGDYIIRKHSQASQFRPWYKPFSTIYYRYENVAKKVAQLYPTINNINDIKNIINKDPYNLFIHASIVIIKEYYSIQKIKPEDEEDAVYLKQMFDSLKEYYMCYVKTYNELKKKFK